MIIIGEKINGAIPSIKQAIAEKNEALIIERTLAQAKAAPLDRQRLLNAREQAARQLFDALDPYILGGEPL